MNSQNSNIKISTPELLWHGGGNENGKPDPVYSVDLHPTNVLATAGVDASTPPKGSVRVRQRRLCFKISILHYSLIATYTYNWQLLIIPQTLMTMTVMESQFDCRRSRLYHRIQ